MIPGIASALMMGGAKVDPLDSAGVIARSVRFRPTASARAGRSNNTVVNAQKITFSWWQQLCASSAQQCVYGGGSNGGGFGGDTFGYNSSAQFQIVFDDSINTPGPYTSVELFRDFGQWEHMCLTFDTTQAVQADRMILKRNNRQVTISNGLALNAILGFLNSGAGGYETIGARDTVNYPDQFFNGMLAHFAVVVGQALTPSSFGVQNAQTGQWRPKSKAAVKAVVDASGHARSSFRPMDDNTTANSLFTDISVNGNNMTATNISVTAGVTNDSLISTPTDCFPVWNALEYAGDPIYPIFSNGNLRAADAGSASYNSGANASMRVDGAQAMWRFEVTVGATPMAIGICDIQYGNCRIDGVAYHAATGQIFVRGAVVATVAAATAGDTIGIEFTDTSMIVHKGGAIIRTQAYTALSKRIAPSVWFANQQGGFCDGNFGQQPFVTTSFSGSSKAISTKNLPFPALPNNKAAFIKTTGLGSAIQAAVLALQNAAGWGSDVRLDWYKRLDASEHPWLIFSDDPTNYLDTTGTGAKAAFTGLTAGGSYVVWSYRLNAANGFATGTFAHTNGTPTTVTDNLGRIRKAITLHRESTGGGAFFHYHPELTAGKLVYLNAANAETTDASINTVLSNSFVVDASLPTGTYRWFEWGETNGLCDLLKYTGNGSADGAFSATSGQSGFFMAKNASAVVDWAMYDTARNPYNPSTSLIYTDLPNVPGNFPIDQNSNGVKMRDATGYINSAATFISTNIHDFPARYSNAR